METIYKKSLDKFKKKDNDESIKVQRNIVIEVLKTLKGLERKLQKQLSGNLE